MGRYRRRYRYNYAAAPAQTSQIPNNIWPSLVESPPTTRYSDLGTHSLNYSASINIRDVTNILSHNSFATRDFLERWLGRDITYPIKKPEYPNFPQRSPQPLMPIYKQRTSNLNEICSNAVPLEKEQSFFTPAFKKIRKNIFITLVSSILLSCLFGKEYIPIIWLGACAIIFYYIKNTQKTQSFNKEVEKREEYALQQELDRKTREASENFSKWQAEDNQYAELIEVHTNSYQTAINSWEKDKIEYEAAAKSDTLKIRNMLESYDFGHAEGIIEYFKTLIFCSSLPSVVVKNVDMVYDKKTNILILDFQLPDVEKISIIKEQNLKPANQSETKQAREYMLCAIPLKIMYQISKTDQKGYIDSIVFNGWVKFNDKSTGKERSEYVLSVHAATAQLRDLEINKLDPKVCLKSLKGVFASKIYEYVPVAPIIHFNKDDKRLVEGKEILSGLTKADNLAAMDWEDFEHLVRELFEKEFLNNGAEVRVTQTSRDKGVDAIIFDPDPIRGGKIVIQAKRYTNTVDLSAVRDLYGTVLNEGANKGILVTTSSYGSDSYEFAKGKPLSLLTGNNLLHLLQKHGYVFKIDLGEAKKLASQRGN